MKTANRIFGGLWMTGGLLMVAAVVLGVSMVFLAPATVAIAGGAYAVLSGRRCRYCSRPLTVPAGNEIGCEYCNLNHSNRG